MVAVHWYHGLEMYDFVCNLTKDLYTIGCILTGIENGLEGKKENVFSYKDSEM